MASLHQAFPEILRILKSKFPESSNLCELPLRHDSSAFCLLLFPLFLSCGGFGEIRICVQSDTFNLKSAVLFLSNHWPFDQSIFSSLHFILPSICLPHSSGCDLLLVCVVDRKVMAGLVVKMARNEGKAEKGGLSSGTTFCAQRGCGCGAHSEDARLGWGWEAAGQQQ